MKLLTWWRASLSGEAPAIHEGDPQVGWYKLKSKRRNAWLPVEIWADQVVDDAGELCQPVELRATVNGKSADPCDIWTWLTPIHRKAFLALLDLRNRERDGNLGKHDDEVFYVFQAVRGGPFIPARTRSWVARCPITNTEIDRFTAWQVDGVQTETGPGTKLTKVSRDQYAASLRDRAGSTAETDARRIDLAASPTHPR